MTPKFITNQMGRTPHPLSQLQCAFSAVRRPLCSSTLLIPKVYPASAKVEDNPNMAVAENVHGTHILRYLLVVSGHGIDLSYTF